MKKICLINAPCEWQNSVTYQRAIPYLGLLSIASFMSYHDKSLEITVLDGNILSIDDIKQKVDKKNEIFGFSAFIYNYKNTVHLIDYVKEIVPDSKVVLGGGLATEIPGLIMKNRSKVDYVVVLEGEQALLDIAQGKSPERINNLVYRGNERVCKNPIKLMDLNSLPKIDYEKFVDLNVYFKNADLLNEKRKLPIYASKGCKWRNLCKKHCIFCSLQYPTYFARHPKKVWDEIEYLKSLGANEVLDASENFLEDMHWFNKFYASNPNIDIDLKMYSRAESITERTIKMLKELGCGGVLIGIESNSDEILKNFNKIARCKDNERALTLLRKYNIMPRVTMILGGFGETEKTANETLTFAKKYLGNDCWITCSILKPIPGSISFDMIMRCPELKKKYNNIDLLDYDDLSQDWVKHFCKVDYSTLMEIEKEILKLSNKNCSWDSNTKLI
ncbi:MAG: B12-binding domain-containing radical SAM protein [Candidatus Thorarchaeota archaeon]